MPTLRQKALCAALAIMAWTGITGLAQSQTQYANGLAFNMDQVKRFSPVIIFHPSEKYFPVSMDYLLQDAILYLKPLSPVTVKATQDDLKNNRGTYLQIEPSRYAGQPVGEAPLYVSVQVPENKSYVDLHFIMLFAYNGPQTVRVKRWWADYNASISTFAEHQGDIETVTVRVDPTFSRVLSVRTEAYGNSEYHWPGNIAYQPGSQNPIIRSALFSHSTYNHAQFGINDWATLGEYTVLGIGVNIIDIVNSNGTAWHPHTQQDGIVRVGLEGTTPVNNQGWAAFSGRIGGQQKNSYVRFDGIGGPLTSSQASYAHTVTTVVNEFLRKHLMEGTGPVGLTHRPYMKKYPGELVTLRSRLLDKAMFLGVRQDGYLKLTHSRALWEYFRKTEWPDGYFSLASLLTHNNIASSGFSEPLRQRDGQTFDETTLWSPGGDLGEGYHAIRAMSDHRNHINVFGNFTDVAQALDATVGLWIWAGNHDNEVWKIEAVPALLKDGPPLKGDLTGDGTLDLTDVVIALKVAVGTAEATSWVLEIADIDGNKVINVADVMAILSALLAAPQA